MSAPAYAALDLRHMVPPYCGDLAGATALFDIRAKVLRSLQRYLREFPQPIIKTGVPLFVELTTTYGAATYFWLESPLDGSQRDLHGHVLHYRSECPRCGSAKHQMCATALG